MRSARRGWTMSESDARSTLRLIEERLRFAGIGPQHRDMLVRLREHLEDDLAACEPEPASGPGRGDGCRRAGRLRRPIRTGSRR